MKIFSRTLFFYVFLSTLFLFAGMADAKVISSKTAKVTQVKIVQTSPGAGPKSATSWGIDSNYIGPGDITRLQSIDIYLDSENRIGAVKIRRLSYDNQHVSSLFQGVSEFSIQTLPPNSKLPHKEIEIAVKSMDELALP